jgi:hypothetical protein
MQGQKQKIFPALFGMVIALILLGLYAFIMIFMIRVVQCESSDTCSALTVENNLTEGIIIIFTTVGGLVSALVVSELAITQPGETPGARAVTREDASARFKFWANIIVALYIVVWLFLGLAALVFGVIVYPGVSETLTTSGTTWLGLAVAAGYAYFGLQPQGG